MNKIKLKSKLVTIMPHLLMMVLGK